MFLIIDNTEEDPGTRSAAAARYGAGKIIFYFWLNNKFVQRIYVTNKNKGVLVCLEKLLSNFPPKADPPRAEKSRKLKDITCLGVVVGAGRFTASRLAVTAVNTLAYSLKIPVVALPKNFDQTAAFKLAKSATAGKYVTPAYSGGAHVGR